MLEYNIFMRVAQFIKIKGGWILWELEFARLFIRIYIIYDVKYTSNNTQNIEQYLLFGLRHFFRHCTSAYVNILKSSGRYRYRNNN